MGGGGKEKEPRVQIVDGCNFKEILSSCSSGLLDHNLERVSSCVSFVDCKKSFSRCCIVKAVQNFEELRLYSSVGIFKIWSRFE